MRRYWSALALTLLVFVLPAAASAAPTWLPAEQLSAPGMTVGSSATAVAPDGTVIAAWTQTPFSGLAADRVAVQQLVARVRPPGGTFGPEQPIASGPLSGVRLAIDPSGRAVLAWVDADTVNTAVRPPGGSFGDILGYTGESTQIDNLQLALDSAGNASLVWRAGVPTAVNPVRAGYRPVNGGLAPAQTLDTSNPPSGGSDHIQEVRLAGNAAGQDVAVWEHEVSGGGNLVSSYWGARQVGGGAYSTPVELQQVTDTSTDQLNNDASPAVAPNGDALVAWSRGFETTVLEARLWPSGGAPGSLEDPTDGGGAGTNPDEPVAAFDSSGSGLVGWEAKTGSTFGLQYANRVAGGTYGPAAALDSAASGLIFAPGPGGGLIATWSSADNTPRAALRAAGAGSFGASHDLAPAGAANVSDGPFAGGDSVGDAAAGWSQFDGAGENNVFVAGFDGAPPMLAGPALASSPVVAGLPVGLSATASDVWSAVSTAWDFGDGASGTGGSVTHAYAKAGEYTARVTSTDAVGNASSATLPVHVIQFLGSFGISRHTFAVGPQATPISAVKRGTAFRIKLGAPGIVKIKIAQKTRGIRIGKRCRALTRRNHHRKHAKRCTLYVPVRPKSTLTRHGQAGVNSYPFSGRIGRRPLKPGSYRAIATVTGTDGAVSRKLVVGFKIVALHPKHHR